MCDTKNGRSFDLPSIFILLLDLFHNISFENVTELDIVELFKSERAPHFDKKKGDKTGKKGDKKPLNKGKPTQKQNKKFDKPQNKKSGKKK